MEMAKVTSKGQITIPKVIRDHLDLVEGSKMLFIIQEDGRVIVENAQKLIKEK